MPVSTGATGFDPSPPSAPSGLPEARRLLAEAGLGAGFDVTLHVRQALEEPGRLVAGMLRPAGIRVDVVALPEAEFFELARRRRPAFYLSRYACTSGDASDLLEGGVHTPDPSRHLGGHNYGGYSDPALDRAIEASSEILEMPSRRGVLQGLIHRVTEDVPWKVAGFSPAAVTESFGISPDGSRLVLSESEESSQLLLVDGLPGVSR